MSRGPVLILMPGPAENGGRGRVMSSLCRISTLADSTPTGTAFSTPRTCPRPAGIVVAPSSLIPSRPTALSTASPRRRRLTAGGSRPLPGLSMRSRLTGISPTSSASKTPLIRQTRVDLENRSGTWAGDRAHSPDDDGTFRLLRHCQKITTNTDSSGTTFGGYFHAMGKHFYVGRDILPGNGVDAIMGTPTGRMPAR